MATGQLNGVIQNLRKTALLREDGLTDAQLLDAFLLHGQEAAFEALVRRHAAMVWSVCLRVLGHSHDAEDAFQAAFLVLVRKADSIWPREMVGNWLYGVAYRTALKAKGVATKRKAREKQVDDMPAPEVYDEKTWSDLRPVLDRELNRLADKYRVPVVLCDLEGKSQREAARQLGWPEGTLTTRLTRARKLLAKRLTKQGIALSAGAFALAVAQNSASAHAPAPLVTATVKAALLSAAGQAAAVASTASVAALTEGVIHAMFLTKIKSFALIVLAVALLGTGGGFVGHQVLANRTAEPSASAPNDFAADFADEFAFFQERGAQGGRDAGRRNDGASITGKIAAVAADGRSFSVETPPANRGEEPGKKEIKINDKTTLTFSGVGPGEAKITAGQMAQIHLADGAKDTAARVTIMGKDRGNREPELQGKVAGVSKDGATLTFEFPPKERGGAPTTKEVKITGKTVLTYSGVQEDGTKPTEGYAAGVWFIKGSTDTADSIHFSAGKSPERGAVVRQPDGTGNIINVSKDGKTVSVTVGAKERGGEPQKVDYKINDKTQVHFNNVGPGGAKITAGYNVAVWLADNSKEVASTLIVVAPKKERHQTLHGKVIAADKDGKSFTIEVGIKNRTEEPKKVTVTIGAGVRVIYMGVGLNGARPTEGYMAEVTLEDGSQTSAAQVIFNAGGERGGARR